MTRAERRHRASVAKTRAAHKLRINNVQVTPRLVGTSAAMHNTCPCWMCCSHTSHPKARTIFSDLLRLHKA